MKVLSDMINSDDYDAIVSLKRSGWILGVFLSNQKTLPLFTVSEIKSIPTKFIRILVVDDKTCTGKSFEKVICKFPETIKYKTACLYKQGTYKPNIYIKNLDNISKMFYEI